MLQHLHAVRKADCVKPAAPLGSLVQAPVSDLQSSLQLPAEHGTRVHEDGLVCRAKERRPDIKASLERGKLVHKIERVVDLAPHEEQGRYLEGTGAALSITEASCLVSRQALLPALSCG